MCFPADTENPTVLYASKGDRAVREKSYVEKLIEVRERLSETDKNARTFNRILNDVKIELGKNDVNSRNVVDRRSNNGNVKVYSKKSSFRPSPALLNCLEDITRTEKRPEVSGRNVTQKAEDNTPAFSMPGNSATDKRYSMPNEQLRYNPNAYTHWLLRHYGINSGKENVSEYSKRLAEIVKLDNKQGEQNKVAANNAINEQKGKRYLDL